MFFFVFVFFLAVLEVFLAFFEVFYSENYKIAQYPD